MPVFEYQCEECKSKFDIYHKSQNSQEEVSCPKCGSANYRKLLSSFSASIQGSSSYQFNDACQSGSCGISDSGGCPGGMCGLN